MANICIRAAAGLLLLGAAAMGDVPEGPKAMPAASSGALPGAVPGAGGVPGVAIGWRTDGTGSYRDVNPPLVWGPTQNVRWSTPLPAASNATPVVSDGRVFICAEPSTLLCVSLKDGKPLWSQAVELPPPDPAAIAKRDAAIAHNAEVDKKEAPLREERAKALQAWVNDKDNKDLEAKAKEAGRRLADFENQRVSVPNDVRAPTHPTNGYSSATPVVDNGRVFVVYGTGIAACYDLEGRKVWLRQIEVPQNGWGFCASPVIADGRLFICINHLVALDPATGKELWNAGVPARWGTSIPTRLGDTTVIVTPSGQVLRAADGKQLAGGLGDLEYNSPLIVGGTAYFIQGDAHAWKLAPGTAPEATGPQGTPGTAGTALTKQELWHAKLSSGARYYASPLFHDGLIYAINERGMLSVLDAATGKLVYKKSLELGGGTVFPSIAQAGGKLFVSCDDGSTLVLEPGRTYRQLADNSLETFRSTPVFVGDVMIVRGMTRLWCIGAGK